MKLRTSERCIAEIKLLEGLRLVAYQDPKGIWTIGYGKTAGVKPGDRTTEAEADRDLLLHIGELESILDHTVKVPLSQGQWDALIDFEYNLGSGTFDHSTLLSLLNAKNYEAAAAQFPRWCHAGDTVLPGLLHRRLLEQQWFEEAA